MAFFARVSDPLVGGTYMTLLNTLSNLGSNWPNTLALWAVDPLTYRNCENLPPNATISLLENVCDTHHAKQVIKYFYDIQSLEIMFVQCLLSFYSYVPIMEVHASHLWMASMSKHFCVF